MANRCNCRIRIEGHPIRVLIASDAHYGIGRDGNMLFRIPSDLRNFKMLTMGKTVFMGRKTFEATPPLPGRKIAVLTRRSAIAGADLLFSDLDAFLDAMRREGGFLVGGGAVIAACLSEVSEIWMTQTEEHFPADVFIPDPRLQGFSLVKESPVFEEVGLHYRYRLWKRTPACACKSVDGKS